jgi:hypothetical protein
MRLSTSSFESRAVRRSYVRPIVGTLAMLVVLLGVLEAATRVGFKRISHIESRTYSDYQAALAIRPGGPSHPSILLLGNSLLLEGLDYDGIRKAMESRAQPVRFVVEQTMYLDWYYGIRRLFSEGARPDRVVLCLDLHQLLSNSILGEYSAFYLMRTQDLARAGKEAGLDLTGISGLLFARYSMFYAGRNNFRNFALNRADPAYLNILHGLANTPGQPLSDAQVLAAAAPRLSKLRALCIQHNVEFDFLLPPGFEDGSEGLVEAGRSTGTSVLVPVAQRSWKPDMFRDDFHLNHEGAILFSKLLTSELLEKQQH